MGLEAGDVGLSITWYPGGLGGRSGVARVSHVDGRDEEREMDRRHAEALASSYFGATMFRQELPGQGVEWTRGASH
jgi:hypothetical protein